ncbi:MAG TPA: UDP-N-acetylmuramate dehydrogenase [Bacteroides sp.]|nr:UDP-N-acetylmuramate dehydrogenase [Bacteroides sp.]
MILQDFRPFIYFYKNIRFTSGMPELHRHYPLKKLNTFGVESHAECFARPENLKELISVLNEYNRENLPVLILGKGSNILFRRDIEGLVVHPAFAGIEKVKEQDSQVWVSVGAGENWDRWVAYATEKGWYGLENLSLIPGSVGSAPIQNIGAYGVEISDRFAWLDAYDPERKEVVRMNGEDCRFGYRTSVFKTGPAGRYIVTRVTFRLHTQPLLNLDYGNVRNEFTAGGGQTPADLRQLIISIRKRKLPDPAEFGNAGSFFKNPMVEKAIFNCIRTEFPDAPSYPVHDNQVKIPAAWLIEKAGWKGKRIGHVGTWPHQPLVVVNYGRATGQEILDFTEMIRADVNKRFGIELEREVRVV